MKIKTLVMILAVLLGFNVPAMGATGTTYSIEVKRLIAAATEKVEHELTLTWDGNALGGVEGAKLFETLFNRMYGTTIRVNFTPGPTMPAMAAKLTQEVSAGRKASTDVYLGTVEHYAALLGREVLEAYDYSKLSPRVRKEFVAPRNIGVEIYSSTGGIIYNLGLVPRAEVPRKLEDVLNPKWKGRIASTEFAAYFDRIAMRPEWGGERMKAFITKLSAQIGGFINVNEVLRITSGEFIMLVLGSSPGARKAIVQGAPLGFVVPEDAAAVHFSLMGVPRNSSSPNLAKLFINTVMSGEGQRLLYKTHFADHHKLPGSQLSELRDLESKGLKPLSIDVQFVIDHPEVPKIREEVQRILRQKPPG